MPHNARLTPTLTLATHNRGKILEFNILLKNMGANIHSLQEKSVMLPQEGTAADGATLYSNAKLKAEAVRDTLNCWALADDSGLFIDALNGLPGVDTATYGGPDILLARMRDTPLERRQAEFRCTLALARPHHETLWFEGCVAGTIATQRLGSGGFGYDSVFIPEGQTLTYSQAIDIYGINGKSNDHRGKAVTAFLDAWPEILADRSW
jgi:XTP/dITP diphosphohydrolase